jgi:hypothetical protein
VAALFNLHRENLWSDPFSGHHLAGASGLRLKHDILMDRPLQDILMDRPLQDGQVF